MLNGEAYWTTDFTPPTGPYSPTPGADVTTVGFSIGQESTQGGAYDNVLNDGSAAGSWYAYDSGDVTTGWTGQDFGSGNEKTIAQYKLYNAGVLTTTWPVDWTFEGSTTGAWGGEEVVLDTQTGQSLTAEVWAYYPFANTTQYRYYRLNVSANGGDATNLIIREIEMMENS